MSEKNKITIKKIIKSHNITNNDISIENHDLINDICDVIIKNNDMNNSLIRHMVTNAIEPNEKKEVIDTRFKLIQFFFTCVGIYLLLGHLLWFIHFVSEFLIFAIMPCKIALHVFSNDHRKCVENEIQNDVETKETRRHSRKIKIEYESGLLRQIFVVSLIRTLISMLSIMNLIPIIGLFSHYVHLFLLFLTILVQTPVTILNRILGSVNNKLNTKFHFYYPFHEIIIKRIISHITESKIIAIKTVRDVMLKYDDGTHEPDDKERILLSLNELGIGTDTMTRYYDILKQKIYILFFRACHLLQSSW